MISVPPVASPGGVAGAAPFLSTGHFLGGSVMQRRQRLLACFSGLAVIVSVAACATSPSNRAANTRVISEEAKAPEWVNGGCSDKKVLCGVGFASTLGDYTVGRQEADSLALVDLRGIMETYVGYLLEGYKKRVLSGDPHAVSIMGQTEEAVKRVVGGTLTGVKIVDHWEHPTKNMIFSLAKVDLNAFKDNVDQMKDLSEEFKKHVRENADRMLQKLDRELEKKKQ